MFKRTHLKRTSLTFVLFLIYFHISAQDAATYDAFVATRYFNLELQLIKTTAGFSPPVASRALGYSGLALYESVVPGIPTYQSGDGIINGLGPGAITDPGSGPYHWPTVANNALGLIIDSLFGNASATNKLLIRNLKDSFNLAFQGQILVGTYANSVAFGQAIGTDVYNFSKTDGGHQGYLTNFPASYTPPTGAGIWEPTPPAFSAALQPYWGNNRPMVAANTTGTTILGAPPAYSTTTGSTFHNAALEVYNTVNNLTQAQKDIANYWADGGGTVTPPGHSISMLTQIIQTEGLNLEAATLAYAKLGMSQMDAFINCWKIKFLYNLLRPITYIRDNIDPAWNAFIATPPFPEYTSGHSTQSGAFETVMTGLFGSSYTFTDHTNGALYGGPRTFSSFSQPAQEAALSRLYGGIHYTFSNVLGVEVGNEVGQNINALFSTQLRVSATADVAVQSLFNTTQATIGQTVTLTVTVTNEGLTELTGLQVLDTLPYQLQLISAVADLGTYNATTGVWDIGTMAAGLPTATLTIQALVVGDGVPYNIAEVVALTEADSDSSPNNHLLTEDDMSSACLSVPIMECSPNFTLTAPPGYTAYQWYISTDGGVTFTPTVTTQSTVVTAEGQYTFAVDGGVLGSCGNQLCCPVIVQKVCCPASICLPIKITKSF